MELDSWIQFVGYFGAIEIGTEKHMSNMQWSLSSYWILPFFWNFWILCQFSGLLMHMPCGIFRQCQYIIFGTNLSAKTVNTFWKMSIMTIAKMCKFFCCCDIYIDLIIGIQKDAIAYIFSYVQSTFIYTPVRRDLVKMSTRKLWHTSSFCWKFL